MVCPSCNSAIDNNVKFCPFCGNPSAPFNERPIDSVPAKKGFWKTEKTSKLGSFFIVLLAIFLFFSSFFTIFVSNARAFVSEAGLKDVIEDISIETVSEEFNNVIYEFKGAIMNTYEVEVTDAEINNFIKRSTLKSYIAKKAAIFIEELLDKKYAEITLNSQMAYELLLENKELLKSELGIYSLTDKQLHDIAYYTFGETEYCIISSNDLSYNANKVLDIISLCLSDYTFIILLLVTLIMIFIMLKINLIKGFKSAAIILTIVSSLYLVIKFALVPLAISLIGDAVDAISSVLLSNILSSFFTPSAIISIILLIGCIGGLIYLKIQKSKQKKQTESFA